MKVIDTLSESQLEVYYKALLDFELDLIGDLFHESAQNEQKIIDSKALRKVVLKIFITKFKWTPDMCHSLEKSLNADIMFQRIREADKVTPLSYDHEDEVTCHLRLIEN